MITVTLNVNHFVITDDTGHQRRVNFSDLTAAEETALRQDALAQLPQRTAKPKRKRSRGSRVGRPSQSINYAELTCKRDVAGVNENKL